jgi:hypothetical protein
MNQSSRSNSLDDEAHDIPAWVYAFALALITLIEIVR